MTLNIVWPLWYGLHSKFVSLSVTTLWKVFLSWRRKQPFYWKSNRSGHSRTVKTRFWSFFSWYSCAPTPLGTVGKRQTGIVTAGIRAACHALAHPHELPESVFISQGLLCPVPPPWKEKGRSVRPDSCQCWHYSVLFLSKDRQTQGIMRCWKMGGRRSYTAAILSQPPLPHLLPPHKYSAASVMWDSLPLSSPPQALTLGVLSARNSYMIQLLLTCAWGQMSLPWAYPGHTI